MWIMKIIKSELLEDGLNISIEYVEGDQQRCLIISLENVVKNFNSLYPPRVHSSDVYQLEWIDDSTVRLTPLP